MIAGVLRGVMLRRRSSSGRLAPEVKLIVYADNRVVTVQAKGPDERATKTVPEIELYIEKAGLEHRLSQRLYPLWKKKSCAQISSHSR